MKIVSSAALAVALLAIPTTSWAEDSDSDNSTIVVTGTRYQVDVATTGTKVNTPLLDLPMAVQVVTRDVIDDRALRTEIDIVKNVSGVQAPNYQFYDSFTIRGFDAGYGATYRNGLQMRGINEAVNTTFIDHVELVKGPTSMLYGRVEPGGFVNVVTKGPQAQAAYSASLEAGSWGMLRASADATGPVTTDGTLTYRLMGDFDKSRYFVDYAHRDNRALAGSLAWKPSDRFNARLDLEYYDYASTWLDSPVPQLGNAPAPVPRNFSILLPQSWSQYPYTAKRFLVAFNWTYALSDNWRITNRFHYVHGNENQQGVYLDSFDGVNSYTGVRFTHSGPDWIRTSLGTNLDLAGDFTTWGIRHKLLVGIDYARFADDTPGSTGDVAGAAPVNIFAPVYPDYSATLAALAAQDATNVLWRDRSTDFGIYAQDQIALTAKLDLLLGGRYDWARDSYPDTYGSRDQACYPNCTALPLVPYPQDKAFSPRAAVLYKLDRHNSVYASFSKSFGDSSGRDENGNPLKPQIGKQWELGYKTSQFGGRLTGSITLYTLTKSNLTEYTPTDFFPRVVGAARSRGVELDLAGQVTHNLNVIASYTYDETRIVKDPYNGTLGNQLGSVAPHVASLWGKWDTNPGNAKGLSFGAGLYDSSRRWGDDENTWALPAYTRIDAMVAWRLVLAGVKATAQVNVNNLFDVTYFDHGGYGIAAYGAPRNFTASLRFAY